MDRVRPEMLQESTPKPVMASKEEPKPEMTEKQALAEDTKKFVKMLSAMDPGRAREVLRSATSSAMSDPMTREQIRRNTR